MFILHFLSCVLSSNFQKYADNVLFGVFFNMSIPGRKMSYKDVIAVKKLCMAGYSSLLFDCLRIVISNDHKRDVKWRAWHDGLC